MISMHRLEVEAPQNRKTNKQKQNKKPNQKQVTVFCFVSCVKNNTPIVALGLNTGTQPKSTYYWHFLENERTNERTNFLLTRVKE